MSSQTQFVAHIKVEKIVRPESSSSSRAIDSVPKRIKGEVAHLVIRAGTIVELRQKVAGHMELVEGDYDSSIED